MKSINGTLGLNKPAVATEIAAGRTHRDNNFNFLRLLFASLVLVAHTVEIADGNMNRELMMRLFGSMSFGGFAVKGFFLLSGFLIVQSWERTPRIGDFFNKRIRRIYPAFLVASVLSIFLVGAVASPNAAVYFSDINVRLVLANLLQLRPPETPTTFVGMPYPGVNNAMWSIAYEFRCYALVILVGLFGVNRQRGIWLGLLILSLMVLPFSGSLRGIDFPGCFRLIGYVDFFVSVFAFFCVGACMYLFRQQIPLKGTWAACAFILLVVCLFSADVAQISLATLGAYVLFWVVFKPIPLLKCFQRFDDISYGLYLYGWPTQMLLQWFFPTASPWGLLPIAMVLASTAGYLSWHLVEQPFLRQARKA